MAFDSLTEKLQNVFRNLRSKGRLTEDDVKAIRGMLDVAALKASKDRTSDIKAAVEALAKEKAWAFEDIGSGYPNVPDGGSAGAGGGTPAADGVEAAFKGMNPGLNV